VNLYIQFALKYTAAIQNSAKYSDFWLRGVVWKIFRSSYWRLSREPVLGLLFVTPLWLVYEFFAFRLNDGWTGGLRTGIDFLVKKSLTKLGIPAGLTVAIPVFFLILLFVSQRANIAKFSKRPVRFAFMFLESLLYAVCFGLVVGGVTTLFLSQNSNAAHQRIAALIMNLGAGVYEEFFFRFILISGLLFLIHKFFSVKTYVSYAAAVALSSVVFAYFHYLDFFSETLAWNSFVFRLFAGTAFSLIFIFRGLGIAAYTHSLYNVFLMFRQ
jgi:hypothetical protein